MERVTVRIPDEQVDALEDLVEQGEYPTKSEAVREAIRDLFDEKDSDVDTSSQQRRTSRGRRQQNWREQK